MRKYATMAMGKSFSFLTILIIDLQFGYLKNTVTNVSPNIIRLEVKDIFNDYLF